MERDLEVLVGSMLTVSEQCAAAAKAGSWMLACMNKGITGRDKETTIPLSSTPEMLRAVWSPLCKNTVDRLERVQRRAKKMGQKDWGVGHMRNG